MRSNAISRSFSLLLSALLMLGGVLLSIRCGWKTAVPESLPASLGYWMDHGVSGTAGLTVIQLSWALAVSLVLAGIDRRYITVSNLSVLAIVAFLLLLTFSVPMYFRPSALMGAFFLLLSIHSFFGCYKQNDCRRGVYMGFLFLAMAALAVPPLLILIPLMWFLFNLINGMNMSRWLISLAGVGMVAFLALGLMFVFGRMDFQPAYFEGFKASFHPSFSIFDDVWETVFLVFQIWMVMIVVVRSAMGARGEVNSVRAYLTFLELIWLCCLILMVMFPDQKYTMWMISLAPLSLLFGYFFNTKLGKWNKWMMLAFLLSGLWYFIHMLIRLH